MSKKNITYPLNNFNSQLQMLVHVPGVSIVHFVNDLGHNQTLIAHSPQQTIHQHHTNNTQTIHHTIDHSLKTQDTVWVMATSYEWGCAHLGLTTPHANAVFIEYHDYLIIDHHHETAVEVGAPLPHHDLTFSPIPDVSIQPLWDLNDFSSAIANAKHAITEGNIYQINLSYPAIIQHHPTIQDLYLHTYALNTPQHGAFISTNEWAIASASPEEFFYLNHGRIRTRPIKGTIGRHDDPIKDQRAFDTLMHSAKDHAELVMITDLMRNDLSRCAETGSVITSDLCRIVPFNYVYHLVSTIQAQIHPNKSPFDVLLSLAPGGSITGCPKRSACQHISRIETHPRDFYTGHIGFISSTGEAAFNVAIRTCYQYANKPIMTHAGCGITIDSTPTQEYQESLDKFRFLTDKVLSKS